MLSIAELPLASVCRVIKTYTAPNLCMELGLHKPWQEIPSDRVNTGIWPRVVGELCEADARYFRNTRGGLCIYTSANPEGGQLFPNYRNHYESACVGAGVVPRQDITSFLECHPPLDIMFDYLGGMKKGRQNSLLLYRLALAEIDHLKGGYTNTSSLNLTEEEFEELMMLDRTNPYQKIPFPSDNLFFLQSPLEARDAYLINPHTKRELITTVRKQPWCKIDENGLALYSSRHLTHPVYGDLPDTRMKGVCRRGHDVISYMVHVAQTRGVSMPDAIREMWGHESIHNVVDGLLAHGLGIDIMNPLTEGFATAYSGDLNASSGFQGSYNSFKSNPMGLGDEESIQHHAYVGGAKLWQALIDAVCRTRSGIPLNYVGEIETPISAQVVMYAEAIRVAMCAMMKTRHINGFEKMGEDERLTQFLTTLEEKGSEYNILSCLNDHFDPRQAGCAGSIWP